MSNDGRFGSMHLVVAFLAGAVAGAVVAVLTTPRSGPEMRDSIKDWARAAGGEGRFQRATRAAREAFTESFREPTGSGDR